MSSGILAQLAVNGNRRKAQTDEKGQAIGRGLRSNETAGSLQIWVTATYQGLNASVVISQINAEPAAKGGGNSKKFLIIALIGGAAAGGFVAAGGGSKSSSGGTMGTISTPPATVGTGTTSIPPPH